MRLVRLLMALAGALVAMTFAGPAAQAAQVDKCNVPIVMSDGTTLYANISLPSAGPRYPTVLTVTGYNKDVQNPTGTNCPPGQGISTSDPNMVKAGYAVMTLDDRGTGASGGKWDSWGKRTQDDYKEALDWLQRQPWSNGKVGMYGGSYMGITSLLVSEADAARVKAGKPRAVQTVWADVPMADAYRDVTFHGGAVDAGFMPLWLGLTSGLSDLPPSTFMSDPQAAAQTYAGHLANNWDFAGRKLLETTTGSDSVYDGPFYRLRSPVERIKSIRIPVAWTGGWWDIFQRGEPLLFEKMTNSPHKTWFQTPNYHGAPNADAWAQMKIGTEEQVAIRWFDRWLKGKRNGVAKLPPVNLYTMGANRWEHASKWPIPGTRYRRLYLDGTKSGSANSVNDGTLAEKRPSAAGSDTQPLLPASSPCSRLTAQWTAGSAGNTPCESDNRTFEASALTYTTPPLKRDTELTGLVSADVWAELQGASDATLVAVLSDVDASGASNQLTAGFLLASQRAVDARKSTRTRGGRIIRPWHPFTKASQKPVTPNDPERYRIEIYPTSNVFKAGHRIRLTIATANSPSTVTPLTDLANETGTIKLLRGPQFVSNVQLPFAP